MLVRVPGESIMSGVATAIGVSSFIQADAARDAARTSASGSRYAADLEMEQYQQTREDMSPYREVATGREITAAEQHIRDMNAWARGGRRGPAPQMFGDDPMHVVGREGGALNELAGYGRSQVDASTYIPDSEVPEFDMSRVNIYEDPGYQFRVDEAMKQIDRVAAGQGKLLSGERLENVISRSQDIASQEFGQAYGRAVDIYGMESGVEAERRRRGVEDFTREYGQEQDYLQHLRNLAQTGQTATSTVASAGANAAAGAGANIREAADANAAGRIGQAGAAGGAIRDIGMLYGMGAFNSPAIPPPPPVTPPPATMQPVYGNTFAYS